jgi:hypothetical protein
LFYEENNQQSVDLIKYNNPLISLSENECVYPPKKMCPLNNGGHEVLNQFWCIFEETQAGNNHNHPVPLWDISQCHEYDPPATEQFAKMAHLVR